MMASIKAPSPQLGSIISEAPLSSTQAEQKAAKSFGV